MPKSPLLLGFIALFLACQPPKSPTPEPTPKPYDFSAVDAFVTQNLASYNGSVVVLVSRNGKLIYQKNWGSLTETTVKPIASASKWLSAGVIMALVDEGKLSLSDSLGKFLPIFTKHGKGKITIRQLFSHTSGFPGDSPQGYEDRRDLTLAQAVDSLAVYTKLLTPPGTAFYYGGVGMQIAGRVAEVASGKAWQALFNEKIGQPCNLTAVYSPSKPQHPLVPGGVSTSARSLLNFVEMVVNKGVFNGKRVLSEAAVSAMLSDQTAGASIQYTPYVGGNPYTTPAVNPVRYGIGNWLDVKAANGTLLESCSPGAFGTHPWQDSAHGVAGVIFTVSEGVISRTASLQIRELVRKQL